MTDFAWCPLCRRVWSAGIQMCPDCGERNEQHEQLSLAEEKVA